MEASEFGNPEQIASRLRQDQQFCRENKIPSNLALRLPNPPSALLDAVSHYLSPEPSIPHSIRDLRCKNIIEGIKSFLAQLSTVGLEDKLQSGQVHVPKAEEYTSTLKVLKYLEANVLLSGITASSSLAEIVTAVKTQLSLPSDLRELNHTRTKPQDTAKAKRCYMCRTPYSPLQAHRLYPSLCDSCGAFNLSSSEMSLPQKLRLEGKVALVTGGRINLGYHTALRLLRCGASVIVSSRYPRDAAMRYSQEGDFREWESRLKVVGADFRTAKDAFQLVHTVRSLLARWNYNSQVETDRKLDILVNNAAQTLTDPVKAEMRAISREQALIGNPSAKGIITGEESYAPRLRGGNSASWIPRIESNSSHLSLENGNARTHDANNGIVHKGLHATDNDDSGRSSWVQTINEIPYEDLISAHSVNAFVPLILCRELLPQMGVDRGGSETKPMGYIVNVSSREGIFEDRPNSASKAGHHVHTNMSKAAINMITETEASAAWKRRRVAMNSVDPGYMSAAPECQPEHGCPIGFEDGAARVLWPVVAGEVEGRVISGRFLKHFEEGAAIIRRSN